MASLLYKWLSLPVLYFGLLTNINNHGSYSDNSRKKVHPIHISTVEISHNATDKNLEITCKIFWDDFETILTKGNNNKRVDLTNDKSVEENNKLVYAYITKHLNVVLDDKPAKLNFVGFEKEDVVIYAYLEVPGIASVNKISVTDNMMHDMFDDQTNIVHVIVKGVRKSTKLDYPNSSAKMEF